MSYLVSQEPGEKREETYGLNDTLESLISTWCKTDDLPVIDNDLDSTRGSLSILDFLNLSDNLDGTFRCQVESFDRLDAVSREDTLGHGGTVSKKDEVVGLLRSESVDPSLESDSAPNEVGHSV